MNIILTTTGLGMGGAEKQICDLADQYTLKGHKVSIISLTNNSKLKPSSEEITIYYLNLEKKIFSLFKVYLAARKLINKIKPDVVHSHMIHANIFFRLLRVTTPMKYLISTMHNTYEGGKLKMLSYRLTDFLADLSTNVSQEAVDIFLEKKASSKNKIIKQYNGIDTQKYIFSERNRIEIRNRLGLDNDTIVLLSVGRLTEAKDYPNLLYSLSKISDTKIKVLIIGDGELKNELYNLTTRLNLDDTVSFLGIQNNVHEWMSACDLFILPSAWEGFGLVVAEAMSCERLVIATDCGGVKEVLGNHGFLIPPKNSDILANSILQAISMTPEEVKKITLNAKEHINNNFSLNIIVDNWLKIYTKKNFDEIK
ncbi:glycosyltransferase [Providencia sp. PROV150]|uniref:glycosyltransferase n=1 Tax=Providencia sp. PROV150 TaxID=2949860 RepID=UPI00234A84DD|nr:glycosyltransferase [Providencia sp. PROV150]